MSATLPEYLGSLAREIRFIARGCFDLQAAEQLRFLAEKLERQANEALRGFEMRGGATDNNPT
jgi:hypothetical protein